MQANATQLLETAVQTAIDAGSSALEHYGDEIPVDYKSDDSPLTQADRASHRRIVEALADATPEIPVLSEESAPEELAGRKGWSRFWCVDPLDGTKEFIKKTGQFTVNIALIEGHEPVLGVVHVPVSGVTYTGIRMGDEIGSWVQVPDAPRQEIRARKAEIDRLTVVASRDHAGDRVKAFLARLQGADVTSMGSSLKFCLIAEGKADFYPRVVPTMEWDTAAAQCVVEAAGGKVTDLEGNRLRYNKDDLRNPSILSFGDPEVDWVQFFAE